MYNAWAQSQDEHTHVNAHGPAKAFSHHRNMNTGKLCAYSCRPVNTIVTSTDTSLKHSHKRIEEPYPIFMGIHVKQDKLYYLECMHA